jgi:hypothetical protein
VSQSDHRFASPLTARLSRVIGGRRRQRRAGPHRQDRVARERCRVRVQLREREGGRGPDAATTTGTSNSVAGCVSPYSKPAVSTKSTASRRRPKSGCQEVGHLVRRVGHRPEMVARQATLDLTPIHGEEQFLDPS